MTDDGEIISSEIALRLLSLPAKEGELVKIDPYSEEKICSIESSLMDSYFLQNEEYNNTFLVEEINKLNVWADDLVEAKTLELKQTKSELKEKEKLSRSTKDSKLLLELQKAIRGLESKQSKLRREMFAVEDEIRERRDKMIEEIEARMKQKSKIETIFTVQWEII